MEKKENETKAEDAELIVPSEKREYPRIALSVPVFYSLVKEGAAEKTEYDSLAQKGSEQLEKKQAKETETENISSGGVLITTNEKIQEGALLHLSMYLPLPGIACSCSVLGEAVRSEKYDENEKYRTAVRFLSVTHHNLNKYTYAALKDLLNIGGPEIKLRD
ncbi:MAG TPA: PilZ domain-containing protein [Firmicutes bacterium]|nr:PilZ domain-containing protein [Bacillota bacterium]